MHQLLILASTEGPTFQFQGLLSLLTYFLVNLQVYPSLVKPQKEYIHDLFDVGVIVGCNGVIWVSSGISSDPDGGYSQDVISVGLIWYANNVLLLSLVIGDSTGYTFIDGQGCCMYSTPFEESHLYL